MIARWMSFVIWAAGAASAVFWLLRVTVPPTAAPPYTAIVSTEAALRGDLSRIFGAAPAPVDPQAGGPAPAADPRYQLVGVVASRSREAQAPGIALIAIDGKPARAYRVGASVDGGETVVQTVGARQVALGPRGGPAAVSLEIPPLPPPATGTLPVPGAAPALPPRPVLPAFNQFRPPAVQQPQGGAADDGDDADRPPQAVPPR